MDCYYFELKLKSSLGAASVDTVLEVSDGGGTVRKLNKNETTKLYLQAKQNAYQELHDMVHDYTVNDVGPLQVAGDDTVQGSFITDKYYSIRPFNRI